MNLPLALFAALTLAGEPEDRQEVIVVAGAEGTPDYGKDFALAAERWAAAAVRGGAALIRIGREPAAGETDRAQLEAALGAAPRRGSAILWLVLIGHGTFDGREAKFNLRGPDVSAAELAGWLEGFERPVAVINCASASGPFLNRISRPGRVVITATRSGHEHNYARFGIHLAAAIADPRADLDKDGQTSLLEGYLAAAARVGEFYEQEGRLATEHSLIEDNGDGLGTPASWFRGTRAVRRARDGAALDGLRAHQLHLVPSAVDREMPAAARARRDQLELEVARLRDRKGQLTEDAYYAQLEPLLLELARLYEELDAEREKEPGKAEQGPTSPAPR